MTVEDAFEARYSPVRSILLGLLSLLFVAGGLWMVGAFGEAPSGSSRIPDWAVPYIGWACTLLFGVFGVLHITRAFQPGIAVRVDEIGMMIDGYSAEPIPWHEFTNLDSLNMMGTELIRFNIPEERVARASLGKRIQWKMSKPFTGFGGSLVMNNTNRKHRDLVEALRHFAPSRLTTWLR